MWLALVLGCRNDIKTEYEKSIAPIYDTITKVPDNWNPDVMIRLDYDKISEIYVIIIAKKDTGT